MLHTLSLTNFQKHTQLTHTFGPGLTLVTGPNWAGKTTILRAVLYALFGTSAVNVKAANLVARNNPGMEVNLTFQVGAQPYHVVRGPKRAELYQVDPLSLGETLAASGQNPVTAMVESLIGDAKSFLTFQTARQGEASGLLTLGAAKLAQHIDTVTGVDTVDKVLARAKTAREALEDVPSKLAETRYDAQKLAEILNTLQTQIEQVLTALDTQPAEMQAAREQVEQAQQAWEQAGRQLADYHHYLTTLQLLTTQREQAEGARRQAQQDLERYPEQDVEAVHKRFAELNEAQQAWQQRSALWEAWHQQYAALEKRMAPLLVELPTVGRVELDAAKARSELAVTQWQQALDAFSQAQASLTLASCSACGRPFADHDVAAVEARLAAAEQKVRQLQPEVDAARTAYNTLYHQHAAHEATQQQRANLQDQINSLIQPDAPGPGYASAWLSEAQQQYQTAVKVQAGRAQALKTLQAANQALRDSQERLTVLAIPPEASQAQVDVALAAYHQAYQNYQEVERGVLLLTQQLSQGERDRTQALSSYEQCSRALADLEQQARRSEQLGQLIKYLRDSRERFTTEAWGHLLAYASGFVQEASGGALTELRRTSGGDFTYVEDGEELPLELASGQQLAILGVAAKLALAAAVGSRFEVLLLDEVSAAASDDNALQLAACLARTGQQILLVSHRDADAAVAADVIAL